MHPPDRFLGLHEFQTGLGTPRRHAWPTPAEIRPGVPHSHGGLSARRNRRHGRWRCQRRRHSGRLWGKQRRRHQQRRRRRRHRRWQQRRLGRDWRRGHDDLRLDGADRDGPDLHVVQQRGQRRHRLRRRRHGPALRLPAELLRLTEAGHDGAPRRRRRRAVRRRSQRVRRISSRRRHRPRRRRHHDGVGCDQPPLRRGHARQRSHAVRGRDARADGDRGRSDAARQHLGSRCERLRARARVRKRGQLRGDPRTDAAAADDHLDVGAGARRSTLRRSTRRRSSCGTPGTTAR